jgi:predicted AlkP superfamily pyrophosphatase or phosphodiesterase
MKDWVGRGDIVMVTLDTLRYDVAQSAWQDGELTELGRYLGPHGWQKRHSPASFTYAAHHAFLAGFLPTPLGQGPHPRLFAAQFELSTSVNDQTFTFGQATLPEALAARGYATVCVGGTGFFNQKNALSRVLPGLFQKAYWRPELGVTDRQSEVHQVRQAIQALGGKEPVFLLLNISALHQPNWFYGSESAPDTLATHRAALLAVDRALGLLWRELERRGPTFVMAFSDHGTAYGEDGYHGHRLGHEVVWTVPYTEFTIP